MIDAAFQQNDPQLLNRITLVLIAIFALGSVFYFVRGYLLAFIGERVIPITILFGRHLAIRNS
jgi:ABC-type bacteriocin/lantibiotic exporter with double-glycine peptidase domain